MLNICVVDLATGELTKAWHEPLDDTSFRPTGIIWAGDSFIFRQERNNWAHYYGLLASGPADAVPFDLTPGDGEAEFIGLAQDGKTLYYTTNVGDIDRRAPLGDPDRGRDPCPTDQGRRDRDRGRAARVRKAGRRLLFRRQAPPGRRPRAGRGRGSEDHLPAAPGRVSLEPRSSRNRSSSRRPTASSSTPGLRPAGHQAGRAPAGHPLHPRRPGPADAPRLPLHVLLPHVLRHESVLGQQGLRGHLRQLPLGHRLRAGFPDGPEPRPGGQRPSTRTSTRRPSTSNRARTSTPRGSDCGGCPTAG